MYQYQYKQTAYIELAGGRLDLAAYGVMLREGLEPLGRLVPISGPNDEFIVLLEVHTAAVVALGVV